jgi:hypothetical protein
MWTTTEIKISVEMRRLFVFLDDGAPIIRRLEQRVGGRIVGRTAPFCAAERAGADANRIAERNVDIFAGDEWDRVELFVGIAINQLEEAVFAGGGEDVPRLSIDRGRV